MIKRSRSLTDLWLVCCVLAFVCGNASAQGYPTHPVKLIVTSSAGGPPDRMARLLAQRLGDVFKQPVVVENKTGGGGVLGAEFVAKAAPDGHTLLISSQSSISLGPLMRRNTPYDPLNDFAHITMVGDFPMYFVVLANHPAKSFQEFLSIVKAKPGSLSYGSSGVGSLGNLIGELLKQNGGVTMTHVAYKGATQSATDLLGGHIDATFFADSASMESVRSGKVRMLATITEKRMPAFPDIPAMDEIVPGVHSSLWFGVSAPGRTPQSVIDRLQAEILSSINSGNLRTALTDMGMKPMALRSEEFVGVIQNEIRTFAPIIKAGNIKVD